MRTNVNEKTPQPRTHEGGVASRINPEQQLRRSLMSCMLWEDEHYESGETIAKRIESLVPKVGTDRLVAMCVEARTRMKLRHAPLWVASIMAKSPKHRHALAKLLPKIVQRSDEPGEFLSLLGLGKKITHPVREGLREAFKRFDAYQLGKAPKDAAFRLRDVIRIVHPKPIDKAQAALWKRVLDGALESPDTWEVALSAGADKAATFTRLIAENKLGALALLRNLRKMTEVGVAESHIAAALEKMKTDRVLPFRFVTAAKYAPRLESELEAAMFRSLVDVQKLPGHTVLIVDVSGSMYSSGNISAKSEITRVDAACALAAMAREICESVNIFATAGDDSTRIHATVECPPRRGFGLMDAIRRDMRLSLGGGGIFLVQCIDFVEQAMRGQKIDRVIVFTDEQDCDLKLNPASAKLLGSHNYIINIASAQNGVAYSRFTHINGFSEAILDYIREYEVQQ